MVVSVLGAYQAFGSEVYYIDDRPLFLYKTINWWYDCLPEQAGTLCGKPIRCSNTGNARVEYDADQKEMAIKIYGGFAVMLSISEPGFSSLKDVWLNPAYLHSTASAVLASDASGITGLVFKHVEKTRAQQFRDMAPDLRFSLEGRIMGLANGRIALDDTQPMLKKCTRTGTAPDQACPFRLTLLNSQSEEIIAVFNICPAP